MCAGNASKLNNSGASLSNVVLVARWKPDCSLLYVLLHVKETIKQSPINCFWFWESCGERGSVAISVWLQTFIDTLCSASLQIVVMYEHALSKSLAETAICNRFRFFFQYRWTFCGRKMSQEALLLSVPAPPHNQPKQSKMGVGCRGSW